MMNDNTQQYDHVLPDASKPIESTPDSLTVAEAMAEWRRMTNDNPIAYAEILTTSKSSTLEQASLFLNVAQCAADKIIVDELSRLYKIEREFVQLKAELDAANRIIACQQKSLNSDIVAKPAKKPNTKRSPKA